MNNTRRIVHQNFLATVSQEGWFGRNSNSQEPGRNVKYLLGTLSDNEVSHRPFTAESIESLEKQFGFEFDKSTRDFFSHVGKIHYENDSYSFYSASEMLDAFKRVKRHAEHLAKFVPFVLYRELGEIIGRNLVDNKIYSVYIPRDKSDDGDSVSVDDEGREEIAEYIQFKIADALWR